MNRRKSGSHLRVVGLGFALAVIALLVLFGASAASASPLTYTLSIVAGTGTAGPETAGSPAISSELQYPQGVAVDAAGNVYIADTSNYVVEKVDSMGLLSVVAGNGVSAAAVPGPSATLSPLQSPVAVALDASGNLYIADGDEVLKVDASDALSVFAGGGATVPTTTAAPATSANVGNPAGLFVDSVGDVFISSGSNQIYKVDPTGNIVLYAGTGGGGSTLPGAATSADLYVPMGMTMDAAGNLYIAVEYNQVIAKVDPAGNLTIVAGTGTAGPVTTGVPATSSDLNNPISVAFDPSGNLLIDEYTGFEIDELDGGQLSIIAGNGTYGVATAGSALSSPIALPYDLAVSPVTGAVYVSDLGSSQVVELTPLASAPGAPTNLQATPGTGSVALSFAPPVFTSGLPITGYDYSTDGGVTWHALAFTGSTTIRGTITGLASGATYQVEVRAVNSVGAGPGSVSVSLSHAVLPTTGVEDTPLLWFGAILTVLGMAVLFGVRRVRARSLS